MRPSDAGGSIRHRRNPGTPSWTSPNPTISTPATSCSTRSSRRRLDELARQRWDEQRSELKNRCEQLTAATRRLDEREHQLERTLADLRARAAHIKQLTKTDNRLIQLRLDRSTNLR
jgi:hypothetical protein